MRLGAKRGAAPPEAAAAVLSAATRSAAWEDSNWGQNESWDAEASSTTFAGRGRSNSGEAVALLGTRRLEGFGSGNSHGGGLLAGRGRTVSYIWGSCSPALLHCYVLP